MIPPPLSRFIIIFFYNFYKFFLVVLCVSLHFFKFFTNHTQQVVSCRNVVLDINSSMQCRRAAGGTPQSRYVVDVDHLGSTKEK